MLVLFHGVLDHIQSAALMCMLHESVVCVCGCNLRKGRGWPKVSHLLMNLKTPTPEMNRKEVVYQISCQDCDSVYIGETSRSLGKKDDRVQICNKDWRQEEWCGSAYMG